MTFSTAATDTALDSSAHRPPHSRRGWLIAGLLLPAGLWLTIFYIIPIISNLSTSIQTGNLEDGYHISWNIGIFWDMIIHYKSHYIRSLVYAAIATGCCIILAFPLCYVIAFRAHTWRTVIIALIVAPFFTSSLIRIFAWKTLFADNGALVDFLDSLGFFTFTQHLGWTGPGRYFLNTPLAVIWGLTYNFLPFMILPIYTSLSKINPILIEAASDLYSNGWQTFVRIIWPLSLPGIISGTLLTFIPAAGDYVNASLLGDVDSQMIGNVIQSKYLITLNYPQAAALSTIFMIAVVALVSTYISFISLHKAGELL